MSAQNSRPPKLTPMPGPDDSQQLPVVEDTLLMKFKKWGGAAAILAGLIASIVGVPIWLLGEVDAKTLAVEERVEKKLVVQLEAHKENIHDKGVSKELYQGHVADFKESSAEAKAERKEILQKLDLIGKETYRSPSKWERTLRSSGLKSEDEP